METIEVSYINWACDCADFIDRRYYHDNPEYQAKEEDCIFIEASDIALEIPVDYYDNGHFESYLRLSGQFYEDKGIPDAYVQKTPDEPRKAKVFRYDSFELVPKDIP